MSKHAPPADPQMKIAVEEPPPPKPFLQLTSTYSIGTDGQLYKKAPAGVSPVITNPFADPDLSPELTTTALDGSKIEAFWILGRQPRDKYERPRLKRCRRVTPPAGRGAPYWDAI